MDKWSRFIERLSAIDSREAKKFARLSESKRLIAFRGIMRQLHASAAVGCHTDVSAIREIIEDAKAGRQIWEETPKYTADVPVVEGYYKLLQAVKA